MPIEIRTGKPGNGKTAFLMVDLMADAKKGERPIVASGIDGLQPGIATILEDPTKWNEIDPSGPPECTCDKHPEPHAHYLRNGAKWYVDEVWKWFGHLHNAARQQTPDHVLALAEHRHRGIDMVWTTQGPNQIYPFARPLVAQHRHYVRRYNTQFVDVFSWEELQEEVKNPARREAGMRTTTALPKQVFGTYKSASEHTIKARIPRQVIMLPLMILAVVAMGWGVFAWLKPDAPDTKTDASAATESAVADPALASQGGPRAPKYATVADYVTAHTPRISTAPWSAPVFDERNVESDPLLVCMIAGAGEDVDGEHRDESCSCRTEQGTPYALPAAECRMVARQGAPYNPYRERSQGVQGVGGAPPSAMAAPAAAPSSGVTIEGEQVTGYGDIKVGDG
jgi:zona occludens toxin (predicted ATPase)